MKTIQIINFNLRSFKEIFSKYLKAHIERFKGLSIDTNDWKSYLYEYFHDKKDILDSVDWESWLYKPGKYIANLKKN